MVATIKFSEFVAQGEPEIGDITVGLKNGANTKFTLQWAFYPPGPTIDRPDLPETGPMRFNTDIALYEYWDGTQWVQIENNEQSGIVLPGLQYQLAYYPGDGNIVLGLATGANGILKTDGDSFPSISQTLPTQVQNNITIVGTIVSGVWQGSPITLQSGGTNTNLAAQASEGGVVFSTASGMGILAGTATANKPLLSRSNLSPVWGDYAITIGGEIVTQGDLTLSGAFSFEGILTGNTSVTFPTSGTLATTGDLPVLPLSLSDGGTGASLSASNGGIVWSDGDSMEILAGVASAGRMLQSGNLATPAWSTAVFASTYAASTLLYSNGSNSVQGLATSNRSSLSTNSTGVPTWLPLIDGQVVVGSTAGSPAAATLTAGAGISITNGSNSITIANTGENIGYEDVTTTTKQMLPDYAYRASSDNIARLEFTLPVTAAAGSYLQIMGKGAGGWVVFVGASQSISFGGSTTTPSTGSISSTSQYDCIYLICTVADTEWEHVGAPLSGMGIDFNVI